MQKKNKGIKAIIIVLIAVLAIIFMLLPILAIGSYKMVFGVRYETDPARMNKVEDYPGLQDTKCEFISNEGQKIAAHKYYRDGQDIKGVVIMAHGIGGGGHNSYMDLADRFTQSGYIAFAYDVTGNDDSEGDDVHGLPQGVIDLDRAISYVENDPELKNYPIFLFGHSWGGYSVTSVLNEHPEVTAVCSVAGFNESSDLLCAQGRDMIGPVIYFLLPYMDLYEYIKFGDYATQTGMGGLAKTDAKILILHSSDDTTVPIEYGYDIYYEKYQNDPDFKFIKFSDKGHNKILSSEDYDTMADVIEFFDSAC